jgi:hypothetical protein
VGHGRNSCHAAQRSAKIALILADVEAELIAVRQYCHLAI